MRRKGSHYLLKSKYFAIFILDLSLTFPENQSVQNRFF